MRSGADVLGLQQTAAKKKPVLAQAPGPKATAQTQTQAHVSDGFGRSA